MTDAASIAQTIVIATQTNPTRLKKETSPLIPCIFDNSTKAPKTTNGSKTNPEIPSI
jgi:hypothetical protein